MKPKEKALRDALRGSSSDFRRGHTELHVALGAFAITILYALVGITAPDIQSSIDLRYVGSALGAYAPIIETSKLFLSEGARENSATLTSQVYIISLFTIACGLIYHVIRLPSLLTRHIDLVANRVLKEWTFSSYGHYLRNAGAWLLYTLILYFVVYVFSMTYTTRAGRLVTSNDYVRLLIFIPATTFMLALTVSMAMTMCAGAFSSRLRKSFGRPDYDLSRNCM